MPPTPATARALGAHLPRGLRGAAGARRDPRHPALYTGPRWSSRRSSTPPACCARSAGASRASAWVWLLDGAGQRLFYPPNVARLGRRALARHGHVPRPLGDRQRGARRSSRWSRSAATSRRRRRGSAEAIVANALVPARARRASGRRRRPRSSVRARRARGRRGLEARRLPAARAQRRAPAARRVPRPAGAHDRLRRIRAHDSLASGRRRRGLPAIEPGMPLPAGTGLDRREFLLGALGLGARRVRRLARCGLERDRRGRSPPRAAGPSNRVLVSVFLDGGADSLSLLFPAGDPLYRKLRPKLALAARPGRRVRRGRRGCAGTRRSRRSRRCTARAR